MVNSDIEVVEGNVVGAIVNASTSMRLPLLGSGLVDEEYVLDLEISQNRSLRIHLSAVIQPPLAVPETIQPPLAVPETTVGGSFRSLTTVGGSFRSSSDVALVLV